MNARYGPQSDLSDHIDTLFQLLQQAIDEIQQGNSIRGIELLNQARKRLTLDDTILSSILDATVQICMEHRRTQQALFEASRNFVKVETDQQAQLQLLAKLLLPPGRQSEYESPRIIPFNIPVYDTLHASHTPRPEQSTPTSPEAAPHEGSLPTLSITLFGHFQVMRGDLPLDLCRSSNGQAILQYLASQPGYKATADILMEILWPDDDPDVARHKLQVAVSALRRSLNQGYPCEAGGGYILYKHQVYQINPLAPIHTDVNQFLHLYKKGVQSSGVEMAAAFEQACTLYIGSFVAENLYVDWALRRREQLSQVYLSMCRELAAHSFKLGHFEATVRWAQAILEENRCDEEAHRQLMLAYAAQGYRNDALRQFHYCEQVLLDELGVTPMLETIQVYQDILTGRISSSIK